MQELESSEHTSLEQQKVALREQIFQSMVESLRPAPFDSRVSIKHAFNWASKVLNIQAVLEDANAQIAFKDNAIDSSSLPDLLIPDEILVYEQYIQYLLSVHTIEDFVRQFLLVKYDSQLEPYLRDLVAEAFADVMNLLRDERSEFFDYPINVSEISSNR